MKKEFVPSAALADEINEWVKRNESSYHELARRSGLSPRTVSKILHGETRYQSIFTADSLMLAMRKFIYHLPTEWRGHNAR